MADMPIGAPRMPSFDPTRILQSIAVKIQENTIQMVILILFGSLIIGYLLYLIWTEYKKNPIKFKRPKSGGSKNGFKLSDILRKKH